MNQLILRLDNTRPQQLAWAETGPEGVIAMGEGALTDAALRSKGRRVIILVPGQDVYLAGVTIPGSGKTISQAIPFALEENLAADVEELHFSHGRKRADNSIPVAVVANELMRDWLQGLQEAGIFADVMTSEILAVPYEPGVVSLLADSGRLDAILVRTAPLSGYAVEMANLAPVLLAGIGESDIADLRLRLFGALVPELLPSELQACVVIDGPESKGSRDSVMAVLAAGFDPRQTVNLIQGPFSRHAEWQKIFRQWLPALILFCVAILLQGGLKTYDYLALQRESAELSRQVEDLYRTAFPKAKKVVDPKAQMEQQLASLRKKDASATGFLLLLNRSSPELMKTPDLKLQNLRYGEGALFLDIELKSLQVLNDLQNRLVAAGGLEVEITTASSKNDLISARLKMSGQN